MPILKKVVLALFFILLSSVLIQAIDFSAKFTPIVEKITTDSAGEYNISITNGGSSIEQFRIFSLNYPDWDIYTEPIQNPITVVVLPRETLAIRIKLDPLNKDIGGNYIVPINIQATRTDEKISLKLPITVTSPKDGLGGYIPTVLVNADIPNEIDPREKISLKFKLINKNVLNITNLVIKINSNLIHDVFDSNLGPKEEKTIERTISLDPKTPPQKDTVTIEIMKGNETIITPIVKRMEVLPYNNIQKEVIPKNKFLQTSKDVKFTNDGNVLYKGQAKVNTTFLRAIFTTTKPKGHLSKEGSNSYLVWDIELEPNQSIDVRVVENYWVLFLIIVIILIVVFLYLAFRTPLIIEKSASDVATKEGGIYKLKVKLHLKNRSSNPILLLEIKDRIPNLASIVKEVSIGSMQPTNMIKHEHKGTIVAWNIEKLDPNEERVINYKVMANLSIIGSFTLPFATAKFKYDGKQKKSHSNRCTVSS